MQMSFKQLEVTLESLFSILPDRVPTFRSRIKQLQRLEFPQGVNVGRGAKMSYGADHLFKMVVAFELISMGLPAQTATQLTETHWRTLSAGLALVAIQQRAKHRVGVEPLLAPEERSVFIRLSHRTMADLQFDSWHYGAPDASHAAIVDLEYLTGILKPAGSKDCRLWLLLNCNNLLDNALEVASERAGVRSASIYDSAFTQWLPDGDDPAIFVHMRGPYPDRSNLEMRKGLHEITGYDPDWNSAESQKEAAAFRHEVVENNLSF